jgi:hypothetical protein
MATGAAASAYTFATDKKQEEASHAGGHRRSDTQPSTPRNPAAHPAFRVPGQFQRGSIDLKVVRDDFPLKANLAEMTRKALPKQVVRDYLRERRQAGLVPPRFV